MTPITFACGGLTTRGFDPVSLITGAGGLWRADKGLSQSAGVVTSWADQSPFANTMTNNTVNGTTPTAMNYSSTGFNSSYPAAEMPNTGNYGENVALSFPSTTTASAFMLLTPISQGTFFKGIWLFGNGNTDDAHSANSFSFDDNGNANTPPVGMAVYQNSLGSGQVNITLNTPTLLGVVFDGTNMTLWQNGNVTTAQVADSPTLGGSGTNTFGLGGNNVLGGNLANYAVVGITQKVMNATDWFNLKGWCNAVWGTAF